jgi:patatin-related protein
MSSIDSAGADKPEQPREAVIPVSDMTQDLRLAVAMSGGVSLAVWMGGVAREVNLLQQASNRRSEDKDLVLLAQTAGADESAPSDDKRSGPRLPDRDSPCRELYLGLLRLLDMTVTVDVLSGTSAGGINAALLGLSSAAGVDLGGLRDLWLKTGSMDALLRDPRESDPPSLMQGDKVLFADLDNGIRYLYGKEPKHPGQAHAGPEMDTTVFITTTMMSGETSRFTDDYGTLVPDVDHHGLFTFNQEALAPKSGEPALTELALAARSSASFPVAFEPSFVPIDDSVPWSAGVPARPDMAKFATMTRSHWVADGGLLVNRPLTPLLARIFAQPAWGQVRRVLAFVVPDGGGTPTPAAAPAADKWGQPPTLVGALKQDLDAQLSQSIASDLQAIRAHNDKIRARHHLRRYLAQLGSKLPAGDGLVNGELLRQYQRQQGASLAQPLLAEVMRQLSAMPLPQTWADELSPAGSAAAGPPETRIGRAMAKILGGGWNPSGAAAGRSREREQHDAQVAWDDAGDPFGRAAMFGLPVFEAARAVAVHLIRLGYERAADPDMRQAMTGCREAVEKAYRAGKASWDEHREVRERLSAAVGATPVPALEEVAEELATAKRQALMIGQPAAQALTEAWKQLVDAMIPLLPYLQPLAAADGRDARDEAAGAIGDYHRYFNAAPAAGTTATDALAGRLLRLVIAEGALQRAEPDVDQPVELVQVSANTRTLLAGSGNSSALPPLDNVNKLRGAELHHFAAFYKSSWRAYDWMWGRLDGCGWLVHILLDPRRILSVVEDDHKWLHGDRASNFARLLRRTVGIPEGMKGDCLEQDLSYLDKPEAQIPVSLPDSALFLARAWQNLITANELPVIARQMAADSATAKQPLSESASAWASKVIAMEAKDEAPAEFGAELPGCPVRAETFAGQVHTRAFALIAAKAAAVATAMFAASEVPSPVRRVLRILRTTTRTGYLAVSATGGGKKAVLAGLVIAVIGGVLATQGAIVIGVPGTVLALAGMYLIALGAWGIRRGLLSALTAITTLGLIGSLTLAWVRRQLWGTGPDGSGLFARDVLPWLRSAWWGGLTVVGGVFLLAAVISILTDLRARRNRRALSAQDNRGASAAISGKAASQQPPQTGGRWSRALLTLRRLFVPGGRRIPGEAHLEGSE